MAKYFETKVKYDRMTEEGMVKTVSEKLLVAAESCTEAEARVTQSLSSMAKGELMVKSTGDTKITEVIGDKGGEHFWLAKPALILIDEKSDKEKRSVVQILIGAEDFNSAVDVLYAHTKSWIDNWELTSLAESAIIQFIE